MPRVSTYLNFMGNTEEAHNVDRSVFDTEFSGPIARMGDLPPQPGAPELTDAEKNLVMHVELPILAGHVIMATDMVPSMGHERRVGNDVTINLALEDRSETERLFARLAAGGSEVFGLADMPSGAYWGMHGSLRRPLDVQLHRVVEPSAPRAGGILGRRDRDRRDRAVRTRRACARRIATQRKVALRQTLILQPDR